MPGAASSAAPQFREAEAKYWQRVQKMEQAAREMSHLCTDIELLAARLDLTAAMASTNGPAHRAGTPRAANVGLNGATPAAAAPAVRPAAAPRQEDRDTQPPPPRRPRRDESGPYEVPEADDGEHADERAGPSAAAGRDATWLSAAAPSPRPPSSSPRLAPAHDIDAKPTPPPAARPAPATAGAVGGLGGSPWPAGMCCITASLAVGPPQVLNLEHVVPAAARWQLSCGPACRAPRRGHRSRCKQRVSARCWCRCAATWCPRLLRASRGRWPSTPRPRRRRSPTLWRPGEMRAAPGAMGLRRDRESQH